jgi:2-dehydropantoate 2-reductase
MKILIWGAGGIGCYYGAKLQLAGHQLSYVARGEHLSALQTHGLCVQHDQLQFNRPVTALSQQQLQQQHHCNDFDLIIITLKSLVTEQALHTMKGWLEQGNCPVLSLQNGVDNEAAIASVVGTQRTLGGLAVRIGGHIQSPGVVEVQGVAQVILGAWPNTRTATMNLAIVSQWLEHFASAGIDVQLSDDIQRELWRKLLINNGVNPLSAITGLDTRTLTADPAFGRAIYTIMEETAAAARCDGVMLNKADVDAMFDLISTFDAIKTSMLVDMEKGRPIEIDAICGAVLRRSQQLNITAPMTELIAALLKNRLLQISPQTPQASLAATTRQPLQRRGQQR